MNFEIFDKEILLNEILLILSYDLDSSLLSPQTSNAIHKLNILKRTLFFPLEKEIKKITASYALDPFLKLIQLEDVNSDATIACLTSLEKFIEHGIFDSFVHKRSQLIGHVIESVIEAKFYPHRQHSTETIIIKSFTILRLLMTSEAGRDISNYHACVIIQCYFNKSVDPTISDSMRRFALKQFLLIARHLTALLPQIFESSSDTGKIEHSAILIVEDDKEELELTDKNLDLQKCITSDNALGQDSNVSTNQSPNPNQISNTDTNLPHSGLSENHESLSHHPTECESSEMMDGAISKFSLRSSNFADSNVKNPHLPYNYECFIYLFCGIADYLDMKRDSKYYVEVALVIFGDIIDNWKNDISKYIQLMESVHNKIFRNILMLVKNDFSYRKALAINCLYSLFYKARHIMKFQFELYIRTLLEELKSEVNVSTQDSIMFLETLQRILNIPQVICELYATYDSDIFASNLLTDMFEVLSKISSSKTAKPSLKYIATDTLLTVGQNLVHIINSSSNQNEEDFLESKSTIESVTKKMKFNQIWSEFAKSTNRTITGLIDSGFVDSVNKYQMIAKYMYMLETTDLAAIGKLLGERLNEEYRVAYCRMFNWTGLSLVEALRDFLGSFRLPGDGNSIEYIINNFALRFHECNPNAFPTQDDVECVAYSLIILNVDQHRPQSKRNHKIMTQADYIQNTRRTKLSQDVSDKSLAEYFHNIRQHEFVLFCESSGVLKFLHRWKISDIRAKNLYLPYKSVCNYHLAFHLLRNVMNGYLVEICSRMLQSEPSQQMACKIVKIFKNIMKIFSKSEDSYIINANVRKLISNCCVIPNEGMYSFSRVDYIRSLKCGEIPILSCQVIFYMIYEHGSYFRSVWKDILMIYVVWFNCNFLPAKLVSVEDATQKNGIFKISPGLMMDSQKKLNNSNGLLNSLLNFVVGTEEMIQQQRESEESDQFILELVKSCSTENIVPRSKLLSNESFIQLIKHIILLITPQMMQKSCPDTLKIEEETVINSKVFLFELMIHIIIENHDRVISVIKSFCDLIFRIFVNPEFNLLTKRAILANMRLCNVFQSSQCLTNYSWMLTRSLLLVPLHNVHHLCRIVCMTVSALIQTNAARLTSTHDWVGIMQILEMYGTGVVSENDSARVFATPLVVDPCPQHNSDKEGLLTPQKESLSPSSDCKEDSTIDFLSFEWSNNEEIVNLINTNSINNESAENPIPEIILVIRQYRILFDHITKVCTNPMDVEDTQKPSNYSQNKTTNSEMFVKYIAVSSIHYLSTKQLNTTSIIPLVCTASVFTTHNLSLCYELDQEAIKIRQESAKLKRTKEESQPESSEFDSIFVSLEQQCVILMEVIDCCLERSFSLFESFISENPEYSEEIIEMIWNSCWMVGLQSLCTMLRFRRTKIATTALGYIQRLFSHSYFNQLKIHHIESLFHCILLKSIVVFLKNPPGYPPSVMEDLILRILNLTNRVFLQNFRVIVKSANFEKLWIHLLDTFYSASKMYSKSQLGDTIPELLKVMFMVISQGDYFSDSEWQSYSKITIDRISGYDTNLRDYLLPYLTKEFHDEKPLEDVSKKDAASPTELFPQVSLSENRSPSPV